MATKSKTQRAKASEKRQAKKAAKAEAALNSAAEVETEIAAEQPKKSLFKKSEESAPAKEEPVKAEKSSAKPKKTRFKFLKDVRSEMKRVTWPTRTDVLRWSGVVIVALLFFGIYVAVLDNLIITPLLVAYSGLA